MIVESWVNERTNSQTRGKVFGVYTMVNLTATTAGQMLLVTGDTSGPIFFLVAAVFYTIAIIPPALSGRTTPKPLQKASFDVPALWKNSPSAVVAITLIGISNSAFGSLGAVFAQRLQFDIATIATFMSITILAGALVQIPIGYLSDRFNRRIILVILAMGAAGIDVFFLRVSNPSTRQYSLLAHFLAVQSIHCHPSLWRTQMTTRTRTVIFKPVAGCCCYLEPALSLALF